MVLGEQASLVKYEIRAAHDHKLLAQNLLLAVVPLNEQLTLQSRSLLPRLHPNDPTRQDQADIAAPVRRDDNACATDLFYNQLLQLSTV